MSDKKLDSINIDSDRLWKSLTEISVFGATPAGGLNRLAASKEDGQARDYVVAAARELGCTVRIDALGNTFMRRAGTDANAKAILIGSHLDSQPLGGKYDGIYGVMAGLELLRALHESETETKHAIELAVWTNEEGARFAPAMMGAAYFAGKFSAAELLSRVDAQGEKLGDSLAEIGYAGTDIVSPVEHKAYLEIHIEQGPILQDENLQIGVVTLVQGMRWFRIGISGQSGHTGTYPMETRRDALVAASHLIKAVQQIGLAQPLTGRATVGHIVVTPNSPNVIPGHVELMVEFRNPKGAVLDVMTASLNQALKETAAKYGVEVVSKQELDSATIDFTSELIDLVEQAASACGKTSKRMISGAGHDACQLSAVMPTTMIFIPCDKGISHAENEAITQDWAADGAAVLVETVLAFDSK
jgi:beta-ureidopropionase / N-carbamoyl-L-amino-acid hydrolase